ncbi:bacteriocin immunity protein [Paenibacillus sp. MMS18-CY102]|uniref:bacteriocin immunity protein n=1 Tax=Paenibacillus sp. MMS18-CY102 TaxID=2682849 RepID=UPI001921F10A|nr:bacteriocin immunity protein [Paenibacillus sp. MMS18-CY102]
MRLSKEELIEIVQKIMNAEGSEEELNRMMAIVERSVPHPNMSDLIFWGEEERSAEDIVEQALKYEPELLL